MSGSLKRCRVAVAKLKKVLSQQQELPLALEQKVREAGLGSIAEAKKYAEQYFEKRNENFRMSGGLASDNKLWANIVEQLPTGEVRFPYSAKKTLGRMRAMVRLVCLEKGYVPEFKRGKKGDEFYTDYMHPVERDIYSTMYKVPVRQMNEKARAFLGLSNAVKQQLRDLRIDEAQ